MQGGLKAAITADVIQGLTMIFVSIGVIIQGVYETGGVEKMYNINKDNGETDLFIYKLTFMTMKYKPEDFKRHVHSYHLIRMSS